MAQATSVNQFGLVTDPNQLAVKLGGLLDADNVSLVRRAILEPVRGYNPLPAIGQNTVNRVFGYAGKVYQLSGNATLRYYDGANWNALTGSFPQPDSSTKKQQCAEMANQLFFTTSGGVCYLDAFNGAPDFAGAPSPLGFNQGAVATVLSGAPGVVVADGKQVAYKYTICYLDSQRRVIESAPSGRVVVANATGTSGWVATVTKNVKVRILLPEKNNKVVSGTTNHLTTSFFIRLYRSANSENLTDSPPDDAYLVYQRYLTAGDITAGYVEVTDICPDAARGLPLYCNEGEEGPLEINSPPPYAIDLASFHECLFYANTQTRQLLDVQILAVGGTDGIQINDTFNVDGVALKAVAAPAAATEYKLDTASTSAATNIANTTMNLVAAINTNCANVQAEYLGRSNDPLTVGKFRITNRTVTAGAFQPFVGTGHKKLCFNPVMPETAGSSEVQSNSDAWVNALYYSKQQQPEAVPPLNSIRIGSNTKAILRIMPTDRALYVLKEDGLFMLTGSYDNWDWTPVDRTCIIFANDSVARVGNSVFAFCTRGVCKISGGNVTWVDGDIHKDLLKKMHDATSVGSLVVGDVFAKLCFGIGYESDGTYQLWLPADRNSTQCSSAYVYNIVGDAWSTVSYTNQRSCGFVNVADDLLYMGEIAASDARVYQENKTYADSDHLFTNAVGGSSNIPITVSWTPFISGDPNTLKCFYEVSIAFAGTSAPQHAFTFSFTSDVDGTPQTVVVTPAAGTKIVRVPVPRTHAYASRLYVKVTVSIAEKFELGAMSIFYDDIGPMPVR